MFEIQDTTVLTVYKNVKRLLIEYLAEYFTQINRHVLKIHPASIIMLVIATNTLCVHLLVVRVK
ncbi:MAG: hypothetical protein GQ569_10830 [Methylococcaceae bacterium]|nr:hypothetical protein [Methylococcaceae bacterium]